MNYPAFILGVMLSMSALTLLPAEGLSLPERQRLADGLYARGLMELALPEYQQLIEVFPEAEQRGLWQFRAGEAAMKSGRVELAETLFRRAEETGGKETYAQRARFRLAELAFANEAHAHAESWLRRLIEEDTDPALEGPARFLLGQVLEGRGLPREALREYEELLERVPEGALTAYAALRVVALSGTDALAGQKEALEQALKNPPTAEVEVEAAWALARLASSQGEVREAADLYWRVWTTHPDQPRVRSGMLFIAWAQLQAGQYEKALELADAVSDTRKQGDADTWDYLQAISLLRLEREEAPQALRDFLSDHPDSRFYPAAGFELAVWHGAREEHAEVVELAPVLLEGSGREADGLWLLAESARAEGQTLEAATYYRRLWDEYPDHSRATDAHYMWARIKLAEDLSEGAESLISFSRRHPEDPRSLDARRLAGNAWRQAGDFSKALDTWTALLREHPEVDGVHELKFSAALVALRLEETERAVDWFRAVAESDAKSASDALYGLGVGLERMGEEDQAMEVLRQALQQESLRVEWRQAGRLRLGRLLREREKDAEALAVLLPLLPEQAGELQDGVLGWMLGVAEKSEKDPETLLAVAGAMTAEKRNRVTREIGYYARGRALRESGELEPAIEAWRRGLAFESNSVESLQAGLSLADTALKLEDPEQARKHYAAVARNASLLEENRMQAEAMFGLGNAAAALREWDEAGRNFMSVAVLFDDQVLSPLSLHRAAESFEKAGRDRQSQAARDELNRRYPDFTPDP